MNSILKYVFSRLKEKSTRVAILAFVVGIAGISFNPEQTEAILGLGTAITLAVIAFLPEKTPDE